jgi:hypothetical protein
MMPTDPPADPPASDPAPKAGAVPAVEPGAAPIPATVEEALAADAALDAPASGATADAARATEPVPPLPGPAPYVPPARVRRCENCGTPLLGEHCYACGQPTKGLIRQFGSILGDFADTVFQIDSRVFRTLGPLLTRPGRLTLEYFEGHRIRYVSPVRLFVFLSILAFLAAQWSVNISGDGGPGIRIEGGDSVDSIDGADTAAEVIAIRDRALADLEKAKKESAKVPGVGVGLDAAAKEIRSEAAARIKEIEAEARVAPKPPAAPTPPVAAPAPAKSAADARASPPGADLPARPGEGPPPGMDGPVVADDKGKLNFNGKPWDAKTNPVTFGWLPAAANAKLNAWIGRAQGNLERLQKDEDKNWIKDAFLGVVPTVLFLLLPLFALLLKVMYLFKRRLYMEHLIVALHSHAFLCLILLLQSLLSLLAGAVAAPDGFVDGVFDWIEALLWAWIPVYLLLSQKRVYGQGWIVTLLKFGVIGVAYWILLTFGVLAAVIVTLVRT